MGNTTFRVPKRYSKNKGAKYAEYYETEEDTLKNIWKRMKNWIKSRYKSIADKNARQKHRTKIVRDRLKAVGLRGLDLLRPEAFYISTLLKPKEKIEAAICGHNPNDTSALLVMTNTRLIYLDIIPLFTTIEEIGFGIIEAVSINIGQFDATVRLYTDAGNFTLNGVTLNAASRFVDAVTLVIEANQSVVVNQK